MIPLKMLIQFFVFCSSTNTIGGLGIETLSSDNSERSYNISKVMLARFMYFDSVEDRKTTFYLEHFHEAKLSPRKK